jgi:Insertion element 4 transposase N-terminal
LQGAARVPGDEARLRSAIELWDDVGNPVGAVRARLGLAILWLSDLGREGLLEQLLADDVIGRALREAPSGHRYDRALNAKMTVICVLVACLFPGSGYDSVLATAFGLPGLPRPPGAGVPTGAAFSHAHVHVCARFGGDEVPSLRMAAAQGRTRKSGVEVVRDFAAHRLSLLELTRPANREV